MISTKKFEEVPIDRLRWKCPLEYIPFETSNEIAPLTEIVGQDRAVEAIKLGLAIETDGYNIFVTGLSGTDRLPTIQQLLEQTKKNDVAPPMIFVVSIILKTLIPQELSTSLRGKELH